MEKEKTQKPFIDRMIGYLSPRMGAERAYYRAAQEMLPEAGADDRPFPRGYARDVEARPTESQASVYTSSTQSRVDSEWPLSQALQGVNSPLNRWRLTRLRDRSRHLDRNNALVTGMLDRASENVIGHGMRVRPTTGDKGTDNQIEDLWNHWLDTADITGEHGGAEFQRLLHRCKNRDGDIGVNLVSRGSDAFLQPIEGHLIDTLGGGYNLADRVLNGIKYNEDNRAVAYYVLQTTLEGTQLEATGIPARNFIFYSRRKGFSETRGEPCFAQVDRLFDQIDGYVEASVIAARIAACQALLIKSKTSAKDVGNLPNQKNAKNNNQRFQSIEPGMVRYLQPDEEVEQVRPEQPTQMFPDFIATLLRFTGLTLGLPLELVFLDFSRTTYSSARASLLQSYRVFRGDQQLFINRVMARIYRWRVSKWAKDGVIRLPSKLLGDPSIGKNTTWWNHEWIAPGWAWIDPVKEIQAAMMEVDAGFNSWENVCLQHGRTSEDILKSKQRTLLLAEQLKVDLAKSSLTRDAVIVPQGDKPGSPTAPPVPAMQDDREDDSPDEGTPGEETPESDD